MGFKPWKVLHILAVIGKPILRLLGVKAGTVADKAADAALIVDKAVTDEAKKTSSHS